MVGTQFGAGGADGVPSAAAACVTTTCLSAIEMTPVRSPPSLAATWKSNALDPVVADAGT